jgi:8-oxo-dGTP diphosphatase
MEDNFVVAVKAIIRYNEKILIIKRSDYDSAGAGIWEYPGGGICFGEELKDALAREVKEETGLTISIGKLLYATTFSTGTTRQIVLLSYLCATEDDTVRLSEEHTAYLWADRMQIMSLLHKPILDDMELNAVWDALK